MNEIEYPEPATQFDPFTYRGWSFLCCSVSDANGKFWPIVFCELCWPGGQPVVQALPTPSLSADRARARARMKAMSWVEERTTAP